MLGRRWGTGGATSPARPFDPNRVGTWEWRDWVAYPGMVSFTSCRPDQYSDESAELEGGLFRIGIAEAFSESARCATVKEMDVYLRRRVPELSHNHQKPRQDPSVA